MPWPSPRTWIAPRRQTGPRSGQLSPVALFAIVSFGLAGPLAQVTDPARGRTIWDYGAFVISLAGASLTYLAAAYYLRVPEFHQLLDTVQRRFAR